MEYAGTLLFLAVLWGIIVFFDEKNYLFTKIIAGFFASTLLIFLISLLIKIPYTFQIVVILILGSAFGAWTIMKSGQNHDP